MDDGDGVYGVLKKLYDTDGRGEGSAGARSMCEEERYKKSDSALQKAGKKQRVYSIIHRLNVLNLALLTKEAEKEEVGFKELEVIIEDLKSRGLIYEPEPGFVGFAGE